MSFAAAPLPGVLPSELLLKRRVPAWLLSLTLHLAAVLVGSMLVRGSQLPVSSEEAARPAAIVLARMAQNTKTNYFTPEELRQGDSEDATATSSAGASGFEDILPAADSPPPSTLARLPQLPGPLAPSGETLVLR